MGVGPKIAPKVRFLSWYRGCLFLYPVFALRPTFPPTALLAQIMAEQSGCGFGTVNVVCLFYKELWMSADQEVHFLGTVGAVYAGFDGKVSHGR
jgi:hypothetical protein